MPLVAVDTSLPLSLRSTAPDSGSSEDLATETIDFSVDLQAVGTFAYRTYKPIFDRCLAFALLILSLVPALAIAAIIVIDSGGPIFYREWRIGQGGRPFRIWKFRSMRRDCQHHLSRRLQKSETDSRITPWGRFLRRWSLDEIPQLINVVRGDMSLIGPRPVIRDEVALYGDHRPFYMAAKPGLSGLWQVSGRSNLDFVARVDLDVSYVRSWSFRKDLAILAATLPTVLKRTGAR